MRSGVNKSAGTRPTVGFLAVADFRSSLSQELVAGLASAAKKLDVNIINFCSGYHYALGDAFSYSRYYKRILPFLSRKNIDGLVSWASSMAYVMPFEEVEKLHAEISTIPLVCIGMEMEGIPSLVIDNDTGIREIMRHMIEVHGFTKIAFIGDIKGYRHHYCNEERFASYKAMLAEKRIPYRDERVSILDEADQKEINRSVKMLLEKRKLRPRKDIEAIVTTSDSVSNRLVEILRGRGIRIPEDIAVAGFNNTFEGIRADPPLTTVDPLYFRYGETAIGMIKDLLDRKRVGSLVRMPVEFLVRRSCGCREESIKTAASRKPRRDPAGAGMIRAISASQPEFVSSSIRDLYTSFMTDVESGTTRFIGMTRMRNTHQMGKMAFLAADYNAVADFGEFTDLFKTHLLDFSIPGAFVVVAGEDGSVRVGGRIVSSLQKKTNPLAALERAHVSPGVILPKACYPRGRFSLIFQLCNYRDSYIGYIVFEMGPFDIPLYDTMRMIASPSIYRLIKSGVQQPGAAGAGKTGARERPRITSRAILDCLSRFVDEPTDISRFASTLGVSVPTLTRKTRSLTGTSAQKLHEKMKMEKAMAMLESMDYSIAEISEKLGYGNQFYFSSVFKRHAGMPPLKWMKMRNPG